jgi:hypothetical protein
VKDTKSNKPDKPSHKSKPSHKNEPPSIVNFPRTGKHTDDDDEWENDFRRITSHTYKENLERAQKQYQKEQLDKHMRLIPGIIQTYGARDENSRIPNNPYIVLTNPDNQYYFDILGIPLEEACSINDTQLIAKYENIINHNHNHNHLLLHPELEKFVHDAKEKLRLRRMRISYANEIPWQKHQLEVKKHEEIKERFMHDSTVHSISSPPLPYEHQILCKT